MQRIVDDPSRVVEDMLAGWLKANEATVAATDNPRVVRYRPAPIAGKVGLVTGGGSGHEPAFLGYVGKGMMDAVAIGEVFSSPSARPSTTPSGPPRAARGWPASTATTPATT